MITVKTPKKPLLILLILAMLSSFCVLPLFGESAPKNPYVSRIYQEVTASVGTDTAGGAVVLAESGTVTILEGFGYSDMSERALATATTSFEIGELTSLVTVITVLELAERGAVSLDSDIADVLPAKVAKKLNLQRAVTLRALLSGTAGFEGRRFDRILLKESHTFETLEEAVLSDIPAQTVGSAETVQHAASPFGVTLAAYVVELVTGEDFEALAEEYVLDPLGMSHTVLLPHKEESPEEAAIGYIAEGEGNFKEAPEEGRSYTGLPFASGAISTPADLSRLIAELQRPKSLSAGTVTEIFRSVPTASGFETSTVAFSLCEGCYALRGDTAYFTASLAIDRKGEIAVITLSNTADSALAALPTTLCKGAVQASHTLSTEDLPELKAFKGVFVPADGERHTFVGMKEISGAAESVKVNKDDGTIEFLDMRLAQVGKGLFRNTEGDDNGVAVEFLFNTEGKVIGAVTADGRSFVSVPFYVANPLAQIFFYLTIGLSVWFLFFGASSAFQGFSRCSKKDMSGVLEGVTGVLVFFTAVFVLWQIILGSNRGYLTLSSFYTTLSIFALIFGVFSAFALVGACLQHLLDSKELTRSVRAVILFLAFSLSAAYWNLLFI